MIVVVGPREPAPAPPDAPYVFGAAHLGLGTPLGYTGAELGVGWSWARVSVGLGRGFRGVETAAMFQLLPWEPEHGRVTPGLGVGVARGPGQFDLDCCALGESSTDDDDGRSIQFGARTWWINAELDVEYGVSPRASLRAYVGVSLPTAIECENTGDGSARCTADERDRLDTYLPYAGGAVVYRIW